jgi:hypothetical protein
MDINLYVTELRLAELREQAARRRLLQAARSTRPPLRVTLGQALIRLGRLLLGGFSVPLSPTRTIGAPKEPC